jgi:DNA-binding MarR family transcriptional regulator
MRNSLALFATLLLMLSLNATYIAHFSSPPAFLSSNATNLTYAGGIGEYTVAVEKMDTSIAVIVKGEEESYGALAYEVGTLISRGELSAPCKDTEMYSVKDAEVYCNSEGVWVSCYSDPFCQAVLAPPATTPKAAAISAPDMETFGQSAARSEAAAPVAPKGVTFEQLLPFLGAALAIVVLSYLTLQQRQVHLEPQEERLLENETRAGIVKELSVADRIPTDLSVKLGKSKATVSEHLDELVTAGFVERVATPGKKFVFYRLTRKGRQAILRRAG